MSLGNRKSLKNRNGIGNRKGFDAWAILLVSAVSLCAQAPDPLQSELTAGVALDMKAQYAEARKHFAKAGESANPATKREALNDMALSFAFESNSPQAVKIGQTLYDSYTADKQFRDAGQTAMELAAICLESGDPDTAAKWYKTGYDAGMEEPGLSDAGKNLWTFLSESGQAKLAARRGKQDEATQHLAAAKTAFDKGSIPEQALAMPFLTGYVAYYAGDYQTAYAQFMKADLHDAFVLSMIAGTYGKMEDKAGQTEYYRQALTINTHNLSTAFGRPLALLPPPE